MNLITVIPITRSKVATNLSYFTAAEIPLGALVSVPLRSKTVHAIVTEIRPAEDLKSEIRNAPFQFRKLGKVKAAAFFPASFIRSCNELADYYATTTGAVMRGLVSNNILENSGKIAPPLPAQAEMFGGLETGRATADRDRVFVVQGDESDRMSSWRSLIRQEFARKKSVAAYAPTTEDAKNIFSILEKGIEEYIFLLHSGLTKKQVLDTWTRIAETKHPTLVVATGSFSVLPRNDIETIIIERENGRGWISERAPYMDMRRALETVARNEKKNIYMADDLLGVETLHRLDEEKAVAGSPFKWRSISNARDSLVDMRANKSAGNDFRVISPELEDLVRKGREENVHLFILSTRRGLAPVTVCDDCETVVSCKNCSAPVVLHTSAKTGKNFFLCHKCGEKRDTEESCTVCGGWRLTPIGIGVERVTAELKAKFPHMETFSIDADSVKNKKHAEEIMERWRARPGSILVGTETALLHLSEKVEYSAVASLDSLFALPDFRIQERIMYMLIRLRSRTERMVLVQSRRSEEKVFEYGLKGNLSDFYRGTLSERKSFDYPPFRTLIKITIEGKKDPIAKLMSDIRETLEPFEVEVFPAFTATVRGNSIIHGLIRIETDLWPKPELIAKLRSLPPEVSVKVDPESLL
ncbi:hypothetical protein KGQ27_01550 [Patescibacteria group bacterium]|nr:hypothetical protein [Patescibacteria group bacterium]MDE1946473.1 hypothetical protein [Patescibacteria group bacterium]MDE2011175.1 hypothetical protein [Patescibacteria group bacterium]MDE2233571.1 hypothetical protein [Patescibacteria group bacterium]